MSKGIRIMLISIITTALLIAGAYFYLMKDKDVVNTTTVDEIVENSLNVPEITTNLLNNDYIRISFTIQTDSKQAKKELEKRTFQVNNVIIKQLSGMKVSDIEGTDGKLKLEETLKGKLNPLLDTGDIEQVYITSCIIQ